MATLTAEVSGREPRPQGRKKRKNLETINHLDLLALDAEVHCRRSKAS